MEHLLSTKQLDQKTVLALFTIADSTNEASDTLKNKIMMTLFYEPSTRTRLSFESAMLKLGGQVISTENAKKFFSAAKGKTLEDTIKVLNNYTDIIVLRHNNTGAVQQAARVSNVPIINAGDGTGEHPTQALADIYTIYKETGCINNISIALVGDLKNGRTVHSLAYLLCLFKNIKIFLVSLPQLKLPEEVKDYLKQHHIPYQETELVSEIISDIDVLYQTRLQKERFNHKSDYTKINSGILSLKLVDKMKPDAIIMHPLPRTDELPATLDENPRAVYFKQVKYGLKIRMALLKLLLAPVSSSRIHTGPSVIAERDSI